MPQTFGPSYGTRSVGLKKLFAFSFFQRNSFANDPIMWRGPV